MNIQPSSFIEMIRNAKTVKTVEHIYQCVDNLFSFEYSPEVDSDIEWQHLMVEKDFRITELTKKIINLKDGKSLIIVGPQGSGKTLLARKIADDSSMAYELIDGISLNIMKNIVISYPSQQFIFTTHECMDNFLKEGHRKFIVKTVSELT